MSFVQNLLVLHILKPFYSSKGYIIGVLCKPLYVSLLHNVTEYYTSRHADFAHWRAGVCIKQEVACSMIMGLSSTKRFKMCVCLIFMTTHTSMRIYWRLFMRGHPCYWVQLAKDVGYECWTRTSTQNWRLYISGMGCCNWSQNGKLETSAQVVTQVDLTKCFVQKIGFSKKVYHELLCGSTPAQHCLLQFCVQDLQKMKNPNYDPSITK